MRAMSHLETHPETPNPLINQTCLPGWSDPYASRTQTAYGTVTRDQDGTVVGMQRTAIDLGVSSSGSLTQSRSVQSASTSSVSLTQSESNALSVSSAATSSDSSLRSFAHSLSEGLAKRSALSRHFLGRRFLFRQSKCGRRLFRVTQPLEFRGIQRHERHADEGCSR